MKTEEQRNMAEQLLARLKGVTQDFEKLPTLGKYLEVQRVCRQGKENTMYLNLAIRDKRAIAFEIDRMVPADENQLNIFVNEILGECSKYCTGDHLIMHVLRDPEILEDDGRIVISHEDAKAAREEKTIRFAKMA